VRRALELTFRRVRDGATGWALDSPDLEALRLRLPTASGAAIDDGSRGGFVLLDDRRAMSRDKRGIRRSKETVRCVQLETPSLEYQARMSEISLDVFKAFYSYFQRHK
jgi:hypothetical protein